MKVTCVNDVNYFDCILCHSIHEFYDRQISCSIQIKEDYGEENIYLSHSPVIRILLNFVFKYTSCSEWRKFLVEGRDIVKNM
jgi:hypothetical protein